jgi:hypothetical protein
MKLHTEGAVAFGPLNRAAIENGPSGPEKAGHYNLALIF